jgi:glycopeptide antibiotics resistance protein
MEPLRKLNPAAAVTTAATTAATTLNSAERCQTNPNESPMIYRKIELRRTKLKGTSAHVMRGVRSSNLLAATKASCWREETSFNRIRKENPHMADIAGSWDVTIDTPIGTIAAVFEIAEQEGSFSGVGRTDAESVPFYDVVESLQALARSICSICTLDTPMRNVSSADSRKVPFANSLARVLFVTYLAILIWLILFKFSLNISSVLHYDKRSLNFVPFSKSSGSSGQIVDNILVFIPFGLLLSVNFKRFNFWGKLLVVLCASVAAETVQYIFAIGATDITDVITNTLGGLIGLVGYAFSSRYRNQRSLDKFIVITGSVLLGLCVLLLIALEVRHGVRYHRHGESI